MTDQTCNRRLFISLLLVVLCSTPYGVAPLRADVIGYNTKWGPHWVNSGVGFCCGLVIEYAEKGETWYAKPESKPEMRWHDKFVRKIEVPSATGHERVAFDLKIKTNLFFELKLSEPLPVGDPKYNQAIPKGSYWVPSNMPAALGALSFTNATLGDTPITLKAIAPRTNGFVLRFAAESKTVEIVIPDWYALVGEPPRPKTSFRLLED